MKEKVVKNKKDDFGLNIEEMFSAGLHFGHYLSNIHPKMMPYLKGVKNNIRIINLDITKQKFAEALKFIEDLISQGKTLLFVGTKIQTKKLIEETAKECNLPFVSYRWLGGTFTNFPVIKKRIDYYKDLEKKKESGELEKYTKKEKAKINKELERLMKKFDGIKDLQKLPEAVFITDLKKDYLAAKEARKMKIKIIAITDSNVDPTLADYPIPANDDAISSVNYILGKVKEVILKAKSEKKEETK